MSSLTNQLLAVPFAPATVVSIANDHRDPSAVAVTVIHIAVHVNPTARMSTLAATSAPRSCSPCHISTTPHYHHVTTPIPRAALPLDHVGHVCDVISTYAKP